MCATGLKNVLESQGRKKRWLADQVRLSESYLGRVIAGTRTISQGDAERIAATLGLPLFLLFEFTAVSKKGTDRGIAVA